MAYFAGNALYIAHSTRRITDFSDYRNMCGAGVVIDSNRFEGNIGLKKHNGGASMHRCIYYESSSDGFAASNSTSSFELALRNKTEDDLIDFEFFYEDPALTEDTMNDTDLVELTVLKYATQVTNNEFSRNYAGMRGSALAMFGVSEMQIANNTFTENGPVTTFSEAMYSPYYKYLALGQKLLTVNTPTREFSLCINISNEFDYMEKCSRFFLNPLYYFDMPALTGAVHIESYDDEFIFFYPYNEYYIIGKAEDEDKTIDEVNKEINEWTSKH